jgi:hypothetical protein
VLAQNVVLPTETAPELYRNSFYVELGGNAMALSLNYERLIPFAKPGNTLALRIGGIVGPNGRFGPNMGYEFYLPLEASVFMGKRAVKLELGLGTTIWGYGRRDFNTFGQPENYNYLEAVPVLRIGGRWQKPGEHWFVRVGFTPFLQENYTVIKYPFSPWAGISVGYNFGG